MLCIWFVDIDGDFKMQLEDLAPLLLEPGKLVVKTINGNSVTGKDLLEYFKVWCDMIVVEKIRLCIKYKVNSLNHIKLLEMH